MYERTRYGTTLHFQKVVQGSDAYKRATDGSSNRASRNRCTGIAAVWPNPEPGATT
jgi:hypothetical protein